MDQQGIHLLRDANEEIKSLRQRNQEMSARLGMFDDLMTVLHTKPATHSKGMSPDLTHKIQKYMEGYDAQPIGATDSEPETESIEHDGHRYDYQYKLAKHGVDTCIASKDPKKYCNGLYLYSDKDPGNGKAFVVVSTNDPGVHIQ